MKEIKLITCLAAMAIVGFIVIVGCNKDAGTGGKAHIHGHVEIEATGEKAKAATVSIWYGKSSADGTADATAITKGSLSMSMPMAGDGEYEFENLRKGDYYVKCMITDTSGAMLMGGKAVTIKKKKEEVEADIHVE